MILPVFLLIFSILLVFFISLRVSVEFIAKDTGMAYTVKGSIFKFLKIFEVKSGATGKRKKESFRKKEGKGLREKILGLILYAIKDKKAKIFHIEKLTINGTFSIEDAAANAILYGIFMVLWQFLLIYLAANFKLEHQRYNLLPDFRNDRNEMIFHAIFRVVLFNMVILLIHNRIEGRRKKDIKSE